MRGRRSGAAVVVGLAVLVATAACSAGGDADADAGASSTSAVPASTAPTTTAPPPPTTTTTTTTAAPAPACPADPGGTVRLDEAVAVAFVVAFVRARAEGRPVADCLAAGAAAAYEERRATVDGNRLCLDVCEGERVSADGVDADPFGTRGDGVQVVSVALAVVREGAPPYRLREEIDVGLDASDRLQVQAVVPQPVTFVDEHEATLVLEQTLDALAVREWTHTRFFNEGVGPEVEAAAPGIVEDPAGALAEACAVRACGAPFTLGPISNRDPFEVTVPVVFELEDGAARVDMTVSSFEGRLTVGQLPPEGRPAPGYEPLARRIFGPDPPTVVLARYDAVERVRSGRSTWISWPDNRFAVDRMVVDDWLVATLQRGGLEVAAVDLSAEPLAEVVIDTVELGEFGGLLGVGAPASRPSAVLGSGPTLVVHDLATGERRTVPLPGTGAEASPGPVDAEGDLVLASAIAGESTTYVAIDWEGAATPLPPPFGPGGPGAGGVQGGPFLVGDGAFAFDIDDSGALHSPTSVRLHSLEDGSELGRWNLGEEPGVVGVRTSDDRWIVGRVVDDGTGPLSPSSRLMVIDTETGDQRFVDVAADVILPTT